MNEGLRFQKVDTVPLTDWLSLGLNLMIIDDLDFVSVALVPSRNSQRKTAGDARSRGSRCFIPNTQAPRG